MADDFDPEQFLGSTQVGGLMFILWFSFYVEMEKNQFKNLQIPILVIGTKADIVDDAQRIKQLQRSGNIADQCGADEICLNTHDSKSLAAGTTDAVKLGRFFDKVIERKYYSRESSTFADRRKYTTPFTSPFTTPFTSPVNSPLE